MPARMPARMDDRRLETIIGRLLQIGVLRLPRQSLPAAFSISFKVTPTASTIAASHPEAPISLTLSGIVTLRSPL